MSIPVSEINHSEHDPLCWYADKDKIAAAAVNDGWPCVCDLIARVREHYRNRVIEALNSIENEPDTAVWYEQFRDDPEDFDKITIMVQLDRAIAAIQNLDPDKEQLKKGK